jgi:NodT family efflux transporter outer membrane factor (OMF) lipoprotein
MIDKKYLFGEPRKQQTSIRGDQVKRSRTNRIVLAISLLQLAACAVGPDYVRPPMGTPAAFKEAAGWKAAEPRDREIRGKWWEAFGDPLLNSLEERVSISNQNLAQAEAAFRQALALAQASRAALFPLVSGTVSTTRSGKPSGGAGTAPPAANVTTSHALTFDLKWEADLWGRLRRTLESDLANAAASEADLEAARLSAQAQLAQDYFQLRALDAQQQLFERTLADYQKSLQLTQNQYAAGIVARENVVLAQGQLATTQAQAFDIGLQRAQLEHAIALLVGTAASDFSLVPAPLTAAVPQVPLGLPSALLERRPDIAAAERRVAAANAQIGVARSAYFPDLALSASVGYQSASFARWLTLPSRFWSVGPDIALTLFDAGERSALTERAIAAYDAEAAGYRQTVLAGFQEVEDNLAALRILEQEAQAQDQAVRLSIESVALTTNQYRAGIVNYLNVITVQNTALGNERNAVDILSRRLSASILLIKALGGGWSAAALVH